MTFGDDDVDPLKGCKIAVLDAATQLGPEARCDITSPKVRRGAWFTACVLACLLARAPPPLPYHQAHKRTPTL